MAFEKKLVRDKLPDWFSPRRHEGTKVLRYKGTKARRYAGTKARRHEGMKLHRYSRGFVSHSKKMSP